MLAVKNGMKTQSRRNVFWFTIWYSIYSVMSGVFLVKQGHFIRCLYWTSFHDRARELLCFAAGIVTRCPSELWELTDWYAGLCLAVTFQVLVQVDVVTNMRPTRTQSIASYFHRLCLWFWKDLDHKTLHCSSLPTLILPAWNQIWQYYHCNW